MPALPLDTAGKYVAAAYLVFLAVILIYVAIMAARLGRVERDITELDNLLKVKEEAQAAEAHGGADGGESEMQGGGS